MKRISLLFVASVLAACAGSAACSSSTGTSTGTADASDEGSGGAAGAPADGGTTVDGEVTSCPPAPLEDEYEGRPCHDPQLGCPYAFPNGFQYKWANTAACNPETIGQCWQGAFVVMANTALCCPAGPGEVPWCGGPITEGAPCNEPHNSECVLPDESATCACDKPGPIWRCAPIDGGVQYCSCSDNYSCPDAGAEAGLDAGAEAGLDAGPG